MAPPVCQFSLSFDRTLELMTFGSVHRFVGPDLLTVRIETKIHEMQRRLNLQIRPDARGVLPVVINKVKFHSVHQKIAQRSRNASAALGPKFGSTGMAWV